MSVPGQAKRPADTTGLWRIGPTRPLPVAPKTKAPDATRPAVDRAGRLPRWKRGVRLLGLLLLAGAAGRGYAAAFPAEGLWPMALISIGLLLTVLNRLRMGPAVLAGIVFGAAFWFTLIDWVALFLGPVPLLALAGLQTLLTAAGAALIAGTYRMCAALGDGRAVQLVVTPVAVAAAWTAREVTAGTWPYSGFAWGRLAFSQSASPYAALVGWVGNAATGFVLVAAVAFAVAVITRAVRRRTGRPRHRLPAAALLALLPLAAVALVPVFRLPVTGSVRIGAVQPNTNAGYFDPLNVPARNLAAVTAVSERLRGRQVDLVVWPEGAAQYDPLTQPEARDALERTARSAGAPVLTGAITARGGRLYNSSLLWQPGVGVTGLYDKVRPVPFGEYVPDRSFWTRLAPDLLAEVQRDYTPGIRPSLLRVGEIRVAVNICFDVVDDGLILGAVAADPGMLIGQTNNADFGRTEENQQQLAIARIRAIETGRAFVNVSTVASTAVVSPDGAVTAAATPFTPEVLVTEVPVTTGATPAARIAITLNILLTVLGVGFPAVVAATLRLRRALHRRP